MNQTEPLDCLIVGGGPAGLAAAVYLARFRRRILVVDGGASRAALIPRSHNHPGFPDGITGPDLVARQRAQAERYGAPIAPGIVRVLEKDGEASFMAEIGRSDGAIDRVHARTALLCTGSVDLEPPLPDVPDAIRRGLVRHCPICDGFEAIDQCIGVIGHNADALDEALFLRTWSKDVTLLTLGQPMTLVEEDRGRLRTAGVRVVEEPVTEVTLEGDKITAICLRDGRLERFDTLYSALGCVVRSDLAGALGANHDRQGALVVDKHQRTSVEGLWAAGDVVCALNQISVAMGQAAIAATDIHRKIDLPSRVGCP